MTTAFKAEYLSLPDRRLAYQRLNYPSQTIDSENQRKDRVSPPGIVFLSGYGSDMTGTKASFLADCCAAWGLGYLRFDYRGNGQSSGEFKKCTLGDWLDDACVAFERLTQGLQIIVGSSMGGWLALLLAQRFPDRVSAIVGIAAAPDFTESFILHVLTAAQKKKLADEGFIIDPSSLPDFPLIITQRFLDEAYNHLILAKKPRFACPIHLLQGMQDNEVPWQQALRIVESLDSTHVRLTLVKDGDHRLSRPHDLDLIARTIRDYAGI